MGQTRTALADVGAVEVALRRRDRLGASGRPGAVRAAKPWVALLPSLDPTTMGWKERDWYLGDHGPALFDRNGNAGPTVWVDGRIVGGWAQRATGEVVYELLEDVGRAATTAVVPRRGRARDLARRRCASSRGSRPRCRSGWNGDLPGLDDLLEVERVAGRVARVVGRVERLAAPPRPSDRPDPRSRAASQDRTGTPSAGVVSTIIRVSAGGTGANAARSASVVYG